MLYRKTVSVKNLFVMMILLVAVCFSSSVFADTIGNPGNNLEAGGVQLRAEAGFWDRDMELEGVDGSDSVEGKRILMRLAYGVNDKVDIFGKIGMADSEFTLYGYDVETDMELTYGGGARVQFYNEGELKAGIVVQVLSLKGEKTDTVTVDIGNRSYTGEIKGEARSLEIDVAAGISNEISDTLNLYGGLYYSKEDGELKAKTSIGSDKIDATEADPIGIFIGGEYNLEENIAIGLEMRIIAEQSFTLSGSYTF